MASIITIVTLVLLLALLIILVIKNWNRKLELARITQKELNMEINSKKIELQNVILQLVRRNEMLKDLRQDLKLSSDEYTKQRILKKIDTSLKDDSSWKKFTRDFELLNNDFVARIKENCQITSNEMRLIALIKMDLTSNEIASLLHVSSDGIKKARFRLRKKMNLDASDSLEESLQNI